MLRTPLSKRKLPSYTRGEEIFNMTSHIVGGAFGILVLVLCAVFGALRKNYSGVVSGVIYGAMMIFLYSVSAIYHGLKSEMPKKVFQVLDHCTIYALILGTYMPILMTGIRKQHPTLFLVYIIVLPIITAFGVTFTAIDFHKYAPIAMSCYFIVGWCALFAFKPMMLTYGIRFLFWLLIGGIAYTTGMIFFKMGITKKYMHSVFHLFILAGSVLQFVGIFKYCILAR